MSEKAEKKEVLQWHPAFYAGIQIEFAEEAQKLTFENEHQLGTKPKEIDVLIIKKNFEERIRKNIGRIFRTHNVIEYKCPGDYLSIDDFYKVYGYACFYKSDVKSVDFIKAEEITVSFVCQNYPYKMTDHIQKIRHLKIERQEKGIYYIFGDVFPMQLIITSELSKEHNFWLSNLTNQLKEREEAEALFREYDKYQKSKLHQSVMNIIVKANKELFSGREKKMCEAIMELEFVKEELEESKLEGISIGKNEGAREKLQELICKKLSKGKSVEQIADDLEEDIETIKELMKNL